MNNTEDNQNSGSNTFVARSYPGWIYEALPPPLKELVSIYKDKRQKDIALISILTSLTSICVNVEIFHSGKWQSVNTNVLVFAPPASHKNAITAGLSLVMPVDRHLLENSMQEKRAFERRKKEGEFEEWEEAPPVYQLLYPMNASSSALIKQLGKVHWGALLHATELFSLTKNGGESWGTLDDLICAAFHNEPYHVLRNDYEVRLDSPRFSIICSGTPEHALQFLPSTSNGMFSRFMFYSHSTPDDWNNSTFDTEETVLKLSENIKGFPLRLYKHLEFGPKRRFSWTNPDHRELLNAKHAEWLNAARRITDNSDIDATVKRTALNVSRLACMLTVTRLFWENESNTEFLSEAIPADFTASDIDLKIALEIAAVSGEHGMHLYENMQANKAKKFNDKHSRSMRLYNILGDHFYRKDVLEDVMEKLDIRERTVGNYLADLVNIGLLKVGDKEGEYIKIKSK